MWPKAVVLAMINNTEGGAGIPVPSGIVTTTDAVVVVHLQ